MAVVELNEQEANNLIMLLDIAVRTKGLEVSKQADYLVDKVKNAFLVKEEKTEIKKYK